MEVGDLAFKLSHIQELKDITSPPNGGQSDVKAVVDHVKQRRAALLAVNPDYAESENYNELRQLLDEALDKLLELGDKFQKKEHYWSNLLLHKEQELLFVKKREEITSKRLKQQVQSYCDQLNLRAGEIVFLQEEYHRLVYYLDRDVVSNLGQQLVTIPKRFDAKSLSEAAQLYAEQQLNSLKAQIPSAPSPYYEITASSQGGERVALPAPPVAPISTAEIASINSQVATLRNKADRVIARMNSVAELEPEGFRQGLGAEFNINASVSAMREALQRCRAQLGDLRKAAVQSFANVKQAMNEKMYSFKLEMILLLEDLGAAHDLNIGHQETKNKQKVNAIEFEVQELGSSMKQLWQAITDVSSAMNIPTSEIPEEPVSAGGEGSQWCAKLREASVMAKLIAVNILPEIARAASHDRGRGKGSHALRAGSVSRGDPGGGNGETGAMHAEREKLRVSIRDLQLRLISLQMKSRRTMVAATGDIDIAALESRTEEPLPNLEQISDMIDSFCRQVQFVDCTSAERWEVIRVLKEFRDRLDVPIKKRENTLRRLHVLLVKGKPPTERTFVTKRKISEAGIFCIRCGTGPLFNTQHCPRCGFVVMWDKYKRMMKSGEAEVEDEGGGLRSKSVSGRILNGDTPPLSPALRLGDNAISRHRSVAVTIHESDKDHLTSKSRSPSRKSLALPTATFALRVEVGDPAPTPRTPASGAPQHRARAVSTPPAASGAMPTSFSAISTESSKSYDDVDELSGGEDEVPLPTSDGEQAERDTQLRLEATPSAPLAAGPKAEPRVKDLLVVKPQRAAQPFAEPKTPLSQKPSDRYSARRSTSKLVDLAIVPSKSGAGDNDNLPKLPSSARSDRANIHRESSLIVRSPMLPLSSDNSKYSSLRKG